MSITHIRCYDCGILNVILRDEPRVSSQWIRQIGQQRLCCDAMNFIFEQYILNETYRVREFRSVNHPQSFQGHPLPQGFSGV
jgi:hypothetical protein